MEANSMSPVQTADLAQYCLQYRLHTKIIRLDEQTAEVVTGWKACKTFLLHCLLVQASPASLRCGP